MLLQCAWCKAVLGETGDAADLRTTQGICDTCNSHMMAGVEGVPLREFLDSLTVPVALVDDDMRVMYANCSAQAALKTTARPIEHLLGGEVLQCENSYEPGGCGKTVNCSACTFRNAVNRCFQSGNDEDVLTTITRRTDHGSLDVTMHISTKRINDQVLIRIDDVKA